MTGIAARLRDAATTLRDASLTATPGEWWPFFVPERAAENGGDWVVDSASTLVCSTQIWTERGAADAHLIALLRALPEPIADWLDDVADLCPPDPHPNSDRCETCAQVANAFAVANAVLGWVSA